MTTPTPTAEVFADAVYWFGRLNSEDPWHHPALRAEEALGDATIVTTEGVLSEILALAARPRTALRLEAAVFVRSLQQTPSVIIIPQTHELFQRGLDLYARRAASTLSLQDCISMIVMRDRGITDVLTADAEFRGFGFTLLMQR